MKILKSLLLVSAGVAAARLFPEQIDMIVEQIKMVDAEAIKAGVSSIKEFVVSVVDIITGNEAVEASA